MSGANSKQLRLRQNDGSVILASGIDAYVQVLECTELQGLMRHNSLTGRGQINRAEDGEPPEWANFEDTDLSRLRYYFERQYGLNNRRDLDDALQVVFSNHKVDPVREALEALQWDGQSRIRRFLADKLGADDTPYTEEVSRLIFAGGVWRALQPGCKFDDMPVLIGKQGGGKSTIVRLLNMNDEWYREVTTIEGKEGIEALQGGWVCEFSEMMAMTNIKEVEGVKAYVTRQSDHVRKAYGRFESDLKRRCVFIGTTNNERFLTDKTGNRRFYPVKVRVSGYDLLDQEDDLREYIRQCWAQAVDLYKRGQLRPYADRSMQDEIRQEQANAMEDDWRVGVIEEWLSYKRPGEYTCVLDVFNGCLASDSWSQPTHKDSIEIGKIIGSLDDWEKIKKKQRIDKYGSQYCYVKIGKQEHFDPKPVEVPDDIPF